MTLETIISNNKGLIIFTLLSVITVSSVCYYLIFIYAHSEYERAVKDMDLINTCYGLMSFDSHTNSYNLNIWDADTLHNKIIQKLGVMKCP